MPGCHGDRNTDAMRNVAVWLLARCCPCCCAGRGIRGQDINIEPLLSVAVLLLALSC